MYLRAPNFTKMISKKIMMAIAVCVYQDYSLQKSAKINYPPSKKQVDVLLFYRRNSFATRAR